MRGNIHLKEYEAGSPEEITRDVFQNGDWGPAAWVSVEELTLHFNCDKGLICARRLAAEITAACDELEAAYAKAAEAKKATTPEVPA